ncbi:MAG TPA: CPBP family intramembrane glutamic endopeptidase [Thermoanaerobaculia bacterium]|jgi:membrane protease YdiL (CAAX protease family)|nr:CPBP family intramembrane glutamic endopeptidase [Thermoanaerobaculia bacterium]
MLRRLSPAAELILVNLICFGPFAAQSAIGLVERNGTIVFDDRRALTLAATELLCGTLAFLLLRARGWKLADLGLRPSIPQTAAGMLLLLGANILIGTVYELVRAATHLEPGNATTFQARLSWPVLILLTLVNPFYDELFLVAYNLTAARPHGAAFAITLSTMVRFLCHLEHGPIASLTILPLGLIFAAAYWRPRLVWPLIVAHGVMDFVGMLPEVP